MESQCATALRMSAPTCFIQLAGMGQTKAVLLRGNPIRRASIPREAIGFGASRKLGCPTWNNLYHERRDLRELSRSSLPHPETAFLRAIAALRLAIRQARGHFTRQFDV